MKTIFLLTLVFELSASAVELMNLKDYLKQELSASPKLAKESFSLNDDQKKTLASVAPSAQESEFTFYYGKNNDGKLEKACVSVPQLGKEGPMSIGVCFQSQGLVSSVVILSSEEDRGKKVAEKSWLSQFSGKKVSDAFVVGTDVNGVTGATWSSKAVSEALRKTSFAFKTFVGDKK